MPALNPGIRAATRTLYDQSFSVIGPTLWNCIPAELTTVESESSFKVRLSKFLYSLIDEPPVTGYMRLHSNSLPEVVRRSNEAERRSDERWSRW